MSSYGMAYYRNGTPEHNWERNHQLTAGEVFVEAGAFWGRYVAKASKIGCRVIAIEPDPNNRATLEEVVRTEKLQNVTVIGKAVASEKGTMKFITAFNPAGHHLTRGPAEATSYESIDVETDTIANMLDSAGVDHVDLLGSDCELGELDLVLCAGRWLKDHLIKHLAFEHHGNAAALTCYLTPLGYRCEEGFPPLEGGMLYADL